jgi:hypothetical protein
VIRYLNDRVMAEILPNPAAVDGAHTNGQLSGRNGVLEPGRVECVINLG